MKTILCLIAVGAVLMASDPTPAAAYTYTSSQQNYTENKAADPVNWGDIADLFHEYPSP